MPYFDDTTYAIKDFVRKGRVVRYYAEQFYETCCNNGSYPPQILCALDHALESNNFNEIVIMADATTKFAQSMAKAFEDEISRAVTKESRFELICVAMAALFVYRFGDVRYGNPLTAAAFAEKERYDERHGPRDFAFLESFIEERIPVIREEAVRAAEELEASIRDSKEQFQKEQLEIQRQKELRKQARAEEARIKHEARMARQKERNAARAIELEQFRQKTLAEQLETVVSNRKVPQAYEVDFGAISRDDLREVPRGILLQVVTSFQNVKDAGWKELQKRAAAVLVE